MFRWNRRSAHVVHDERRASPRYQARATEARIVWREGLPPYSARRAQLVDISMHGAQVRTRHLPQGVRQLWFRLDRTPWEWVRAEIRNSHPGPRGRGVVLHLAFVETCPPGLVEDALTDYPNASRAPLARRRASATRSERLLKALSFCLALD